jgi:peptide-methionine (S)-S-oxide reductase
MPNRGKKILVPSTIHSSRGQHHSYNGRLRLVHSFRHFFRRAVSEQVMNSLTIGRIGRSIIAVVTTALIFGACTMFFKPAATRAASSEVATRPADPSQIGEATFAAGCFWGVEAAFRHTPGVISTTVGYTGGTMKDPTYKDVCTEETGHAEVVLVEYDKTKTSFPELLDAFWSSHDPTTVDQQGPDYGSQYRSAIFYHTPEQKTQAEESLKQAEASGVFHDKIVTQIVPAGIFYKAEDYHQQYFFKRGVEESCHTGLGVVRTALAKQAAQDRANAAATQPAH